MNTLTRRIGVALTAALLATTAIAPMASAREWRGQQRQQNWHHDERHDGGNGNGAALAIGLGLAAVAGIAILSANSAPQPVYQPAYPAYPQPSYVQPAYAPPVYAQPAYAAQPNCTTINGAPACMAADGNWYYVR